MSTAMQELVRQQIKIIRAQLCTRKYNTSERIEMLHKLEELEAIAV